MGFHDHRGHVVKEKEYYCLGYGSNNKCDNCQREKTWLDLNKLPNQERLDKQKNMIRVEEDLCVLNGRKYFKE